ncbi:MAG: PIN domain-containing protein [Betaproteobacteria bacterium]|nr:PIN domain-containing protein [Betaproteobacteria bacterium]MCC6248099.1 PIN domain-containing protein [Rubrivivax sp.]MCL4697275.1 PIN domain-containing protein [Burkholderiaceae bacterium]
MLVVDSSVWIAFFDGARGARAHQADLLEQLLDHGEIRLVVPDLVLFEVLRGFRHERDLRQARLLMQNLAIESTLDADTALLATEHYRSLRSRGHTVRSAVDVLVATFCIERDYALLHDDRDFDAFESLRGLRVWRQ